MINVLCDPHYVCPIPLEVEVFPVSSDNWHSACQSNLTPVFQFDHRKPKQP